MRRPRCREIDLAAYGTDSNALSSTSSDSDTDEEPKYHQTTSLSNVKSHCDFHHVSSPVMDHRSRDITPKVPPGTVVSKRFSKSACHMMPLISANAQTLRVSGVPFLQRILAMSLPWIKEPKYALKSSMTSEHARQFLSDPHALPHMIPSQSVEQSYSPELYFAVYLTYLLEDVRAMLASGLENVAKLQHVPVDLIDFDEVSRLAWSESHIRNVALFRSRVLEGVLRNGISYQFTMSVDVPNNKSSHKSVIDTNDIVLLHQREPKFGCGSSSRQMLAICLPPNNSSPVVREKEQRVVHLMSMNVPISELMQIQAQSGEDELGLGWLRQAHECVTTTDMDDEFTLFKLGTLTTHLREFNAIAALPRSLLNTVVHAPESFRISTSYAARSVNVRNGVSYAYMDEISVRPEPISAALYARLKQTYNSSQLSAIAHVAVGSVRFGGASTRRHATGASLIFPGATIATPPSEKHSKIMPKPICVTEWGSKGNCSTEASVKALLTTGVELTLIQGPPGTGKTRTIIGILSVLLCGPGLQPTIDSIKSQDSATSRGAANYHSKSSGQSERIQASRPHISAPWIRNVRSCPGNRLPTATRSIPASSASTPLSRPPGHIPWFGGRILVCAPSNAAVDEIMRRAISKDSGSIELLNAEGTCFQPKAVRVGVTEAIHPDLVKFTLEYLTDKHMESQRTKGNLNNFENSLESLTRQVDEVDAEIGRLSQNVRAAQAYTAMADVPVKNSVHAILTKDKLLRARKRTLLSDISSLKKRLNCSKRTYTNREAVKREILMQAQIVFCTLASANAGDMITVGVRGFDAIIVDEACQSTEPSLLIPFAHCCRKLILVGDPQQLPPTVISTISAKHGYAQSLFERLASRQIPMCILQEQFRMSSSIREFPSRHFYANMIADGRNIVARRANQFIFQRDACFIGALFVDVSQKNFSGQSSGSFCVSRNLSYANLIEAEIVVAFYEHLLRCSTKSRSKRNPSGSQEKHGKSLDMRGRVGVITPYRGQIKEIRAVTDRVMGPDLAAGLTVSTVDGFQGQEKDVIIISCVRGPQLVHQQQNGATRKNGIGFVEDPRRLNVALTRARHALIVVGDAAHLSKYSPDWCAFINHCKRTKRFTCLKPGTIGCCNTLSHVVSSGRYKALEIQQD